MIDPELLTLIISAVSGPASGIAVALLCMVGFGWFLVKYLLPQQDKHLEKVLDDSKENRKVFQDAVKVMSDRLDKVEDDVSEIKIIVREKL